MQSIQPRKGSLDKQIRDEQKKNGSFIKAKADFILVDNVV